MLTKISFMFRYKHVHHYIQEKNIKGLLPYWKMKKIYLNMIIHVYTFHTKIIAQTYNLCMTFCGHGEYSTTHAHLCDELDIVFDEWCHDLITHTPWRPWPFNSLCMKSLYNKVLFVNA